jgi:hypothetical protein
MPRYRKIDASIVRSGPWGAAFIGGSLTLFATLIASERFGFSGHPAYFVVLILVSGALSFRWWRGILGARLLIDLPKEAKDEAGVEIISDGEAYYQPINTYSEMRGLERFFFDLSLWISRIVWSGLFFVLTYLFVDWVLPSNASDIPISEWTLKLISGFLISGFSIFFGVYLWSHNPTVKDHSQWSNHPYSEMWNVVLIVFSVGFFYYLFFVR